jgi:hypothetical protein
MAFGRVPVRLDSVLDNKRVSVLRWAEFAALAFLMTFLTEAFGVHHQHDRDDKDKQQQRKGALSIPMMHALCQGLSTLVGMLFPYCPNAPTWYTLLLISCGLFSVIFPRLYSKQAAFRAMKPGRTVQQAMLYDRAGLSLKMLQACTICWTLFPIVFFLSGFVVPYFLPPSSVFRDPALPMICEALLDILSKVVQMNVIMDVHNGVFNDQDGARALQRLHEVKEAIGEKWLTANDVVIISVRQEFSGTVTFMVSPSTTLVVPSKQGRGSADEADESLVYSLGYKHFRNNNDDDDDYPSDHAVRPSILSGECADMRRLSALAGLVVRSWNAKALPRATLSHNVDCVPCDAEITRLEEHLLVVVVRGLVAAAETD